MIPRDKNNKDQNAAIFIQKLLREIIFLISRYISKLRPYTYIRISRVTNKETLPEDF